MTSSEFAAKDSGTRVVLIRKKRVSAFGRKVPWREYVEVGEFLTLSGCDIVTGAPARHAYTSEGHLVSVTPEDVEAL